MLVEGVVGDMGGDVLIAVAVVVGRGNDMGVALDIIDNLLFENRLEDDSAGTGSFHFNHFVDVGRKPAAADNDGAIEFQSQIFSLCIHRCVFLSV